jgi:hypothetical protein
MEQTLADVFEEARIVVAAADRKVAEEEERRREGERAGLLQQLGVRIEESFDFTSKEKLELEPRLDVQRGVAVVEFVVRSLRAIFLLSPNEGNTWTLRVLADGHEMEVLSEFQGGTKDEVGSQRLAAARIVTMIGNWIQNARRPPQAVPVAVSVAAAAMPTEIPTIRAASSRLQLREEPKHERTYGTMGKFLGA